jgi:hypothetical protein
MRFVEFALSKCIWHDSAGKVAVGDLRFTSSWSRLSAWFL